MKIILSPAKKMNSDADAPRYEEMPQFLPETEQILEAMKQLSGGELQKLWKCNDGIAQLNIGRLAHMDLRRDPVPAVLAYEGIAYQYMAPAVFEDGQFAYLQEHLRILSGFYGVLRPMDGVTPYRLEMQAKLPVGGSRDLYGFWGRKLYDAVKDESGIIINLASAEYSKCIEKYLTDEDRYITVIFCEKGGKGLVTKGTYAKMARGEMVRFMAEKAVEEPEGIKRFDRLGYVFRDTFSDERKYVFERVTDVRLTDR